MQGYRGRFRGKEGELIKFAQYFGRSKTRDRYAPRSDPQTFTNYLIDISGDRDIGLHPRVQFGDSRPLGEQVLEAFISSYEKLKGQLSTVEIQLDLARREVEILRAELNKQEEVAEIKAVDLMERLTV